MKRKLLFAALCVVGAVGFKAHSQELVSPTNISINDFTALSGDYTIEVDATTNTEIKIPYDTYTYFTYTPSVTGTVRFVNKGNIIHVYEKESSTFVFKGVLSSFTSVEYPEVGDNYASANYNLLSDADFNATNGGTLGTYNDRYALGSSWTYYPTNLFGTGGSFRVASNSYAHENSTTQPNILVWRTDGSYKNYYFGQQLTGLVANGKYIVYFKSAQVTNSTGKFNLRLGYTAGGKEYSSAPITVAQTTNTSNIAYLTTPATLGENSYFSVYNEENTNVSGNKTCCQVDYIILAEAKHAFSITGTTSAVYVAEAVYPNAVDMTLFITNAAVKSTSGWTNGRINSGQQYEGAPDNTYMDTWNATLDQKQTTKVLPVGYYLLQAATRSSAYASGNIYAYVTADDATFKTDIHKEGSEGNLLGGGWAWTRVPVTLTQASTVTIGFWSNCSNNQWAGADNFTLTYYDSELNLAAAHFEQVRSDATTWKSKLDATLTTGAKNSLTAEDGKTYTSVAEYESAIARLEAAITFARTGYTTLRAQYDAIKTLVKALPEQNDVYTGSATINVNEEATDALCEAATSEADMKAAILVWRNAAATFLGAVSVNENKYFDITNIFLDNANFSTGNILGWETNYVSGQQANNIGYQGASYTNGDVTIGQFIEAWLPQPGTLGDGYLRQTVKNLPEGKYTLEADAISVQQKDENEEVTGSYLYIHADNVDYKTALNTLNNKPQHFSREFLNTGEGDVIFGLKTESSTGNWLCADNFTVKFYGVDLSAYEVQLAEAVEEANAVTNIPAGAATVLSGVVEENNKTYTTSRAYSDAIAAIQAATTTAQTFVTPYAEYQTALENTEDFEENNMIAADWTTLQNAISDNTVNEESTDITVEQLTTATANLNAAITDAYAAVAAKNTYDTAVTTINGGTNVDLTSLLINPSFETNGLSGWTNTNAETQTNKAFDNVQGDIYAQRWHFAGDVDINQTVAYLPAGVYQVSAYSYFSATGARIYANSTEATVTTSANYSVIIEIADKGSIKLGASCESKDNSWWCVDDFKLTYLGTIDDVTYTPATGKMGTDKSASQDDAEATFLANKTIDNYNALLTAIAEAEASVANYATLKTAIDKAEAVMEVNNFVTSDAPTAFANEIETATIAWTNVTYTDAQATAEIAKLGTTVSGHRANSTGLAGIFMTSTWGKTTENWWDAPYINTWSTEGDNDGSGFSVPFFEYYTNDTENLAANTFTATLTGLDKGRYEVEIWARVQRRKNDDFNSDGNMITMSVNGGDAVSIMNNTSNNVGSGSTVMRLGRYTAVGDVADDGILTLTIDVKLGANVHWLSWRDVKYTKLDEVPVSITADNKYGTFIAPFEVKLPEGITAYSIDEIDGTTIRLVSEFNDNTIPANTPVLLYAENGCNETFYGQNISTEDTYTDTNGFLTGVLVSGTKAPVGTYVLQKKNEKVGFYKVGNSQPTMTQYRAYLNYTAPEPDNAKPISLSFEDDEATAIAGFEALTSGNMEGIYTTSGAKVNSLQKGMNIVKMKDGKTVKMFVR